jgi:hypothetical protein
MPTAMAKTPRKTALPPAVREFFRATGRRGGKIGGKLRWQGVPAAERSALAKKAVAAREAKRKKR